MSDLRAIYTFKIMTNKKCLISHIALSHHVSSGPCECPVLSLIFAHRLRCAVSSHLINLIAEGRTWQAVFHPERVGLDTATLLC